MDWKIQLMAALTGLGVALLAGKGFRRLVFLPFEWLVRKTNTRVDDVILDEAQSDLGIDSTLDRADTLTARGDGHDSKS